MGMITTLSPEGHLVVPKAVRDQLGWQASDDIEFVLQPTGVTLRAVPRKTDGLTVAEALARLRAISRYDGPPITDAQISEAAQSGAADNFVR